MRKDPLVTGLYYHIYNRGVDKRDIFMNKHDLERFVLSVKEFNTVEPIRSIRDRLEFSDAEHPTSEPLVSMVCYCFNPNHFHFILKQEVDGGISEFFKRLLGGYTKYFNSIHDRSGALFESRFKSHLIDDDAYFLKIHPYVNYNYLVHQIPKEKQHLVFASDKEYEADNFNIVSEKEARDLMESYGVYENFKKESMSIISAICEERGIVSLLDEDLLP